LRLAILISIVIACATYLYPQDVQNGFVIKGKLVEQVSKAPIEYATFSLFSSVDSSLVTGVVSDAEGRIVIAVKDRGIYYAEINFIGFQPWTLERIEFNETNILDLGTLFLGSSTLNLEEVTVTERRTQMQMQLDKRIFNADANLTTRGADALQLLGEVPSVEVDPDGQISLRGSNDVNVLIDGRPTGIPASQLLQSIPASQIERIEIITNPSAKYEAEGMSGILNVVLKKNGKGGVSSTIGTALSMGIRPRYEGNASLAFKRDKINAYLNYSYNFRNRYSIGTIDKELILKDTSFFLNNNSLRDRPGISHNLKLGLDYSLNSNNTLYFSSTLTPSARRGIENTDYLNYDTNFSFVEGSSRKASFEALDVSNSFNLGWTYANSDDKKLDIDLFHNTSQQTDNQFYNEFFFDEFLFEVEDPLLETFDFMKGNEVTRLSVDYAQGLLHGGKLELGYRYDRLFIDNEIYSEFFDRNLNQFVSDGTLNNRFLYTQSINALYGTYAYKYQQWNFQLGLRYEGTQISGDLVGSNSGFDRNFNQLFPSASVLLKIKEGWDMSFSYSKRVKRPSAGQLNPFTDYSDPYNLRSGNASLDPEIMDAVEIGMLRIWEKVTVNASLFGNYTQDEINRFLYPFDEGVTLSTFENVGESVRVGMEFFINYYPLKWIRMNLSGNIRQNTFLNTNVEIVNLSTTSMFFNYMSNFSLPRGVNFQISSRYRPGFATNQGKIYEFFNVDFALAKDFLNNKLSVTIQGNDIFNTLRFKYDLIQSNIVQQTLRDWDSRRVGVAISYRFGQDLKEKSKSAKRGDNSRRGSEEMEEF
jgi:outer membrane receptor protein involved in Fe transport